MADKKRKPAHSLLEEFLKENKIVLNQGMPVVGLGDDGRLIVRPGRISAIYEDERQPN